MDTNELKRRIKALSPEGILEIQAFGRAGTLAVWVEAGSLSAVGNAIKNDTGLRFDWLENLSAMEINRSLALSYFLRSTVNQDSIVIRVSVVPKSSEEPADAPSVIDVWPMAASFEREISDLYGVRFRGNELEGRYLLPEGWVGYPLRKDYVFPTEFLNIPHLRPTGHTGPDEHAAGDYGVTQ